MAGWPIWFIRHGQTDWNAEGRLQGQRDTELNAKGLAQATRVAGRLKNAAGGHLEAAHFVASPLRRASRTMEIVRATLGLPEADYRVDQRLMEINFGSWEGSTWAQVRRRDPAGAAARDRDRWHFRPDGPAAESYAMLTERIAGLRAELDRPTVMVAHGGVARALLVTLGHLDIRAAPRIGIRQGEVLVLDGDGWRWA